MAKKGCFFDIYLNLARMRAISQILSCVTIALCLEVRNYVEWGLYQKSAPIFLSVSRAFDTASLPLSLLSDVFKRIFQIFY